MSQSAKRNPLMACRSENELGITTVHIPSTSPICIAEIIREMKLETLVTPQISMSRLISANYNLYIIMELSKRFYMCKYLPLEFFLNMAQLRALYFIQYTAQYWYKSFNTRP